MGENLSPNPDPEVMPLIDIANIACGGHAGDPETISQTLELAQRYQVKIGAHPGYPDKANFGRHSLALNENELHDTLYQQLEQIQTLAKQQEMKLHHIKPHGALYLDMMRNEAVFESLLNFCQAWSDDLPLMIQGGVNDDPYRQQAAAKGVALLFESFADRAYLDNGQLMPRSEPNSLYDDPKQIVQQTHRFIQNAGTDSICFHSDNPASVAALKLLAKESA